MVGKIVILNKEKQFGIIRDKSNKEYEFDFKDVLCDVSLLNINTFIEFDLKSSRVAKNCRLSGYTNKSKEEKTIEQRYFEPKEIYVSKENTVKGWDNLEVGSYEITASGDGDPHKVKQDLFEKARAINGNAILNFEYYRTTGSKPGTGKGTYYYTIHNYRGVVCNIGKKTNSKDGVLRKDIEKGIDATAEKLEEYYRKKHKEKQFSQWWIAIFIFIVSIFTFNILPDGVNFVAAFIEFIIIISLIKAKYDGWWLKRIYFDD